MSVNLLNQALVQLTQINCGECGGTYAINERYREQKYQEGGSWNCPYCKCGWGYSHNGENARLKRELEAEKNRKLAILAEANQLRDEKYKLSRRLTAQRGATKRIKNRVAHGVCPCCTRSFTNLRRHMDTKHPDYTAEKVSP